MADTPNEPIELPDDIFPILEEAHKERGAFALALVYFADGSFITQSHAPTNEDTANLLIWAGSDLKNGRAQ